MPEERKPNFLIGERSPYLQEHAYNPVSWYPWGDQALKKAKNDGKPIFLSIGYSTCHWCHQLAKESFEDEVTAAFMNKNFISIKVDREERPELDAYYMGAVQAMTGAGGWPLSVFLTPDLKPFYGGTYFPPEPRYGMPSFRQVLEFVTKVWKDSREEAVVKSEEIASALAVESPATDGVLTKELLDAGYSSLASQFDQQHGGFGGSPKFPLPLAIGFMLRYHFRTGNEVALLAATRTLDSMMAGGIRDHVGGGFHRYATDRVWLVPHFEKMLYDNALIAKAYVEGYLLTKDEGYAQVARETLSWILGEMRDPDGGFYSAQDADTPQGEGVYYTWTPDEVGAVLGRAGDSFCSTYGVTRNGNFEGRTILHLKDPDTMAKGDEKPRAESKEEITRWKRRLFQARIKRQRPATDRKVLTSWNGLAISALAQAAIALRKVEYLEGATRAADFILATNSREGRLLRRSIQGEAALDGTLEDYAFFVQGLLDLFEATSEPRWLEEAKRLNKVMVDTFLDQKGGGLFMAVGDVPGRLKEDYDGPTPSGNSVAVGNLILLSEITGDEGLRGVAEGVLKHFRAKMEEQPSGHAKMLSALDLMLGGMKQIVITAPDRKAAGTMLESLTTMFIPNKTTIVVTPENYEGLATMTPLLEGRRPGKSAIAYVCENFSCKLPARTPAELARQLSGKSG